MALIATLPHVPRIRAPDARRFFHMRPWLLSAAAAVRCVRQQQEGTMQQVRQPHCEEEEAPPATDPLTLIFEWIEHDDDALEDAPPAPSGRYPAPRASA